MYVKLIQKIKCKKLILPLLEKSDLTDETSRFLIEPIKKILNVANFYNIYHMLRNFNARKTIV